MTAYLALREQNLDKRVTAPPTRRSPPSRCRARGGRADQLPRPALRDDAAERQRRRGDGRRGRRADREDGFVEQMNAAADARARRHELREPDRARRPGQLLDGGRPREAGDDPARGRLLPQGRRHRGAHRRDRPCLAPDRHPRRPAHPGPVGRRRQDRPHRRRRLRPRRLRRARGHARSSRSSSAPRARPPATTASCRCSTTGTRSTSPRPRSAAARRSPTRRSTRAARVELVARQPSRSRRGATRTSRPIVDAPGEVEGPIRKGERLGSVEVTVDGRPAGELAADRRRARRPRPRSATGRGTTSLRLPWWEGR